VNPTLVLAAACGALLLIVVALARRVRQLSERLAAADFQQRSLSTTYGRITEQWFPLMEQYPYDPQGFRFLGTPIDGVQFEDDRIVFVEFKTNKSQLSKRQKHFRALVESGEVYFEEFRFTEDD
jgi:predicted Holliday junction resolvase-like endonuclease